MGQLATPVRYYTRVGLGALALALLASALLIVVAVAHALLVKSEPEDGAVLAQSPERVVAWYSQELDTGRSTLQVFDGEDRQVDNGDGGVDLNDPDHASMIVSLPASLPDGTHIVRWTVVSAQDEDATEGEFTFSVGEKGTVPGQNSASETSPPRQSPGGAQDVAAGDRTGVPGGWIAAGLGVVILAVGTLLLRQRLAGRG